MLFIGKSLVWNLEKKPPSETTGMTNGAYSDRDFLENPAENGVMDMICLFLQW